MLGLVSNPRDEKTTVTVGPAGPGSPAQVVLRARAFLMVPGRGGGRLLGPGE